MQVLIDSGVIFAQRFLSQRFPECASKCVCELLDDDSMRFLHHASAAEGSTETTAIPTMPRASTDRKPHPRTAEDGKQVCERERERERERKRKREREKEKERETERERGERAFSTLPRLLRQPRPLLT